MITLYTKTNCPYCAVVLKKIEDLGIEIDEKNIADDTVAEELVAHGGKRQVPYLIDPKTDTAIYESSDITAYLEKEYGEAAADTVAMDDSFLDAVSVAPRVHRSPGTSTCESCEG